MALDLAGVTLTGGTQSMAVRFTAGYRLRANGQENLWSTPAWSADPVTGSVAEGAATIVRPGETDIVLRRLCKFESGGQALIINSVGSGLGYFAFGGLLTAIVETSAGHAIPVAGINRTAGSANWSRWELSDANWALLDAVAVGQDIILVAHTGGVVTYAEPASLSLSEVHAADSRMQVRLLVDRSTSDLWRVSPALGSIAEGSTTITHPDTTATATLDVIRLTSNALRATRASGGVSLVPLLSGTSLSAVTLVAGAPSVRQIAASPQRTPSSVTWALTPEERAYFDALSTGDSLILVIHVGAMTYGAPAEDDIRHGASIISAIKHGANDVTRVYSGADLIYGS